MGGGDPDPDARHPFASEGRTYSKGILLEGKHGFGPKSSRTKLTEKTKLENLGRGFCCLGNKLSFRQEKNCRLGKKNCCLDKNSGPSEAGRSYERELSPPCVLRQLEGGPFASLEDPCEMAGRDEARGLGDFGAVEPGVPEHHSRRFPKKIIQTKDSSQTVRICTVLI